MLFILLLLVSFFIICSENPAKQDNSQEMRDKTAVCKQCRFWYNDVMLKDKIQEDLKQAMLAKEEDKLSTIRMLKSALQYFEIQKRGAGYEATDDDVIEVVGKEIKKRREAIEMFIKGGRQESADKETKELEVLQTYLPEQMSEEEIRTLVKEAISQTGATAMQDMGKVMGVLMTKTKGKADGQLVSTLVREKLS